jgi:heme-degrading monooxygenase HmoA
MAVIMMFEAPGATLGDYEEINAALGIHGDEDAPDGLVWHTASTTNDGVLIVDVWESEQKLRHFFEDRLQDALAQAGVKPGETRILPVHNMFPRGGGSHPGTLLVIEVDGVGPDIYDRMTSTMDAHVRDGSDHPAVAHTAATTDRGMLIVDIWESPEAFSRFAETQVASAGKAVGLPPFEPRFYPIHNFIRSRAAVPGRTS